MVIEVVGMVSSAFAGFFSVYSGLDFALGISAFAGIAIAMWSITRFLVLPILGGAYSINDGGGDILTETVTEMHSTSDRPVHVGKQTIRHTVTRTSSRTSRRRAKE